MADREISIEQQIDRQEAVVLAMRKEMNVGVVNKMVWRKEI